MIRKAVLKNWYPASYTATIQITGSKKAFLEGIDVARNIPPSEMVPGRNLVVMINDKNNGTHGMVIGVYR